MFSKVLVANRGEIAVRVMRTLRNLGIRSIAVYSEADADAPHVLAADEAYCIGGASARDSYLNISAVIDAARTSGAQAVHPGYGFLAENSGFVRACDDAGIVFLGPTVEAMAALGDKSTARGHADAAGVPTVPGVEASDDPAAIEKAARTLPLPILLKAASGGGGKGMRLVDDWTQLSDAIDAARREGQSAFGDSRLIVESYIRPVRHVEVQIIGDGQGRAVALGERECSLQRRHQKIIEETPSVAVDDVIRKAMWADACRLAERVDYRGAGTVEFLLSPDGKYYFLEMNTRLQVEHPVTELVTGLDLVHLQLRVAAGEGIPFDQDSVRPRGAAIEARLYAENPSSEFLPTSGRVLELFWPHHPGVRIDSGIARGQEVGVHYDPLLAKINAWGETRESARTRLIAALKDTSVVGLITNQGFLIDLLESDAFKTGETYTHTTEDWVSQWQDGRNEQVPFATLIAAAVAMTTPARRGGNGPVGGPPAGGDPYNPWPRVGSWRV